MYILILLLALTGLYFLNRAIIKQLYLISYLLLRTQKFGVYFYFLLFFPGIIIHELAHFFMASILNVPAGEIEIFPKKKEEGKYTLGRVKYARTDPVRQNLIGIAPIIVGSLAIVFLVKFGLKLSDITALLHLLPTWLNLLFLYLILVIANTMFASEEDRKSILALPILITLLILFLNAFGAVEILEKAGAIIEDMSQILAFSYLFVATISLVLFLALFLVRFIIQFVSPFKIRVK